MTITLLADAQYHDIYASMLSVKGFEIVTGAETLLDLRIIGTGPLKAPNASLIIANTLTQTATSYAKRRVNLMRFTPNASNVKIAGVAMLPAHSDGNIEISFPYGTDNTIEVTEALSGLGKLEFIRDTVAGVFPRTLAMIINEAAFAVQESVATAAAIDSAMIYGTNYPQGPLAWCDSIGAEVIVAVLDALGREYGYERYRAASLLRLHAESQLPFHAAITQ